jgi:hypothetical protein
MVEFIISAEVAEVEVTLLLERAVLAVVALVLLAMETVLQERLTLVVVEVGEQHLLTTQLTLKDRAQQAVQV